MPPVTRGGRHNPGNIDYNPHILCEGQLTPDPTIEKRVARFDTAVNGIRAMAKLVLAYRGNDGVPWAGGRGCRTFPDLIPR